MSLRHAHGYVVVSDPGRDRPLQEADTVQCVHCGGHFPKKPPKIVGRTLTRLEAEFLEQQGRTVRGFCMNCDGPICGPDCAVCVPTEQLLENYEQARPLDFKPVAVNVPKLWTPEAA